MKKSWQSSWKVSVLFIQKMIDVMLCHIELYRVKMFDLNSVREKQMNDFVFVKLYIFIRFTLNGAQVSTLCISPCYKSLQTYLIVWQTVNWVYFEVELIHKDQNYLFIFMHHNHLRQKLSSWNLLSSRLDNGWTKK